MVKVAFFAEILIKDFDGASRTMFQIIDRIEKTKFDYFFIYGRAEETIRTYKNFQTTCLQLPVNNDYSLSLPVLTKQKLYEKLDEFSPDVIHIATPSPLGFFALKYARKRNIPVISIYHTHFISYVQYYFRSVSFMIRPIEKWMVETMQKFYLQCTKVYVPTPSMKKALKGYGISTDKMKIWQRGIDLDMFRPDKKDLSYIRKITGNTAPNLLFASRLVWEKNLETLISLYELIQQKKLHINLIIAGEGSARKSAESQMPNAFFVGKLEHDELSTLYASADVFVFTSISETYGNVVLEAMASGTPCVIANGGGSADLIVHRESGFKSSPNNAKEYLHYIEKLLNEPTLAKKITDHAIQYTQQMSWNALTRAYFDDIRELGKMKIAEWSWTAS